jgi:hypothetical protein
MVDERIGARITILPQLNQKFQALLSESTTCNGKIDL